MFARAGGDGLRVGGHDVGRVAQRVSPTIRVPAKQNGRLNCGIGRVPMFAATPALLAREIDRLASDEGWLAEWQDKALGSRAHSWDIMTEVYQGQTRERAAG